MTILKKKRKMRNDDSVTRCLLRDMERQKKKKKNIPLFIGRVVPMFLSIRCGFKN